MTIAEATAADVLYFAGFASLVAPTEVLRRPGKFRIALIIALNACLPATPDQAAATAGPSQAIDFEIWICCSLAGYM